MDQRLLRRGAGRLFSAAPGSGVFTGYASLFDRRDSQGDTVMAGAFTKTLKAKGPDGIRMLFQHNPAEPVGNWIDLWEDANGLKVRGRLNKDVQRGRELLSLLEAGGLDGLSIGFKTIRARKDRVTATRQLLEIDLWEISLVTFPMLDGARVSTVKSRAWTHAEGFFSLGNKQATTLVQQCHEGENQTWI